MKKSPLLMFAVVLMFVLAACGGGNQTEEGTDNEGENNGNTVENSEGESEKTVVRVGTSPTYPPFESEEDGDIVGFDIALIEKIAEVEDLQIDLSSMQFNGLIPALQNGQVDAVIAGLSITDKRMEQVNFTNAYYESGLSVLTKPDSGIDGFDDLEGKLIGTQKGSSSVNYLMEHGIDIANIEQYSGISTAYNNLENGGIDAVFYDNPSHIDYLNTHDTDAEIVGDLLTGEHYGIAVNKEETELLEKLNDGLAQLQESGEYEKLFEDYLNGDKNGLVEGVQKPEDVVVSADD